MENKKARHTGSGAPSASAGAIGGSTGYVSLKDQIMSLGGVTQLQRGNQEKFLGL